MTLPRLVSLNKFWSQWPPVYRMMGWYLGHGKEPKEEESNPEAFIAELEEVARGNR